MNHIFAAEMKNGFGRFLALLLLPVFCYTTAVKEIHFLFLHHVDEHHDHCNNHLHDSHEHDACTFCKIDISVATEAADGVAYCFSINTFTEFEFFYSSSFSPEVVFNYTLRGPPAC